MVALKTFNNKLFKRILILIAVLLILSILAFTWSIRIQKQAENVTVSEELVKQIRETQTKEESTFFCESYEEDLEFRRELATYQVNETGPSGKNETKYVSMINFYIQNKKSVDSSNLTIRERIPKTLTENIKELNFTTIKPLYVLGDSVIFRFDKIKAGEVKIVGYSIDKRLSKDVLRDFKPPEIITKTVYGEEESNQLHINRALSITIFIFILLTIIFLKVRHFIRSKFKR